MRKRFGILVLGLMPFICRGEVMFIPGWDMTGMRSEAEFRIILRDIYPREKITIFTWPSDTLSWETAKTNAAKSIAPIVADITVKSPRERAELTLIGHSLGGRIAVGTARRLAQKHVRIRRFILLGAAVDCDADLSALAAASTGTNINVFSRSDNVLKLAYGNWEKRLAAGFCGVRDAPKQRFVQYEATGADAGLKLPTSLDEAVAQLRHQARIYLRELAAITAGKRSVWRPKFDYSGVKLRRGGLSIPQDWVVPPPADMTVRETYADWSLCQTDIKYTGKDKDGNPEEHRISVYFIVDHCGRIVLWNLLETPLRWRFNAIKKQIRPL